MQSSPLPPTFREATTSTFFCIAATIFFSLFVIFSLYSSSSSSASAPHSFADPILSAHHLINPPDRYSSDPPLPAPPSIAYFISGSYGDSGRIVRLVLSVYHPKNVYLLHLDRFAPQTERDNLALKLQSLSIFRAALNVHVIGKADFAYIKGSSPVSSVLRGASILLRLKSDWDWFINLSATDYPLVRQDDLLHILSVLPKELNFMNHTSYLGWREWRRLKPVIVDPGLYLDENTPMFYATKKRQLPNAFQLFRGSATAILSRMFVEFCIMGTENLPRTLLMYLANTPSSLPNYFPTILCNSRQFNKTTINHNLQYAAFDNYSLGQEPRTLNAADYDDLINSGSAFATHFPPNDPLLDRIDTQVLGRSPDKVVSGGWCLGDSNDTCGKWGDADVLRPGPGAERLGKNILHLLSNGIYKSRQCIVQ